MDSPTSFDNSDRAGTRVAEAGQPGNINHLVNVYTWSAFLFVQLGIELTNDASAGRLAVDVRAGAARSDYRRGLSRRPRDAESRSRAQLAYYPEQVWFYLLASAWKRIAQEEPFVGRCGEAGDEMGSRIITARLMRDLMRLCFHPRTPLRALQQMARDGVFQFAMRGRTDAVARWRAASRIRGKSAKAFSASHMKPRRGLHNALGISPRARSQGAQFSHASVSGAGRGALREQHRGI